MSFRERIRQRTDEVLTTDIRDLLVRANLDITNMVDIGCGDGSRAVCWSKALGIPRDRLAGSDAHQPYVDASRNHFECMCVNIEWQPLPFEPESVDLVVCNQVLEHVKDIYFVLDEIYRVTKTGKFVLISVPNLASLHSRLLLALGRQPTCIRYLCATEHIRGFSYDEFTKIMTATSCFEVIAARGSGFYPFIPPVSGILSWTWGSASIFTILLLRKLAGGGSYRDYVNKEMRSSYFYDGPPPDPE